MNGPLNLRRPPRPLRVAVVGIVYGVLGLVAGLLACVFVERTVLCMVTTGMLFAGFGGWLEKNSK